MAITVSKTIAAPADVVFDWLADPTNLTANPGVFSVKVTKPGATERFGVDAEREIVAGGLWFHERISEFERPARIAYQVVSSRPPLPHRGGRIELRETDGGTMVRWTLDFGFGTPVIGPVLNVIGGAVMSTAFHLILNTADQKCRARNESTARG